MKTLNLSKEEKACVIGQMIAPSLQGNSFEDVLKVEKLEALITADGEIKLDDDDFKYVYGKFSTSMSFSLQANHRKLIISTRKKLDDARNAG